MDLTPLIPENRKVVESYALRGFKISGEWVEGAVLLLPTQVIPWQASDPHALTPKDFEPLFEFGEPPEILLIGLGASGFLPPKSLREALRAKGPVADAMATGPACRTYNVLMAEGRRVAAALLPSD
ncbi:Mth938-like domain-containing protein [Limibacillus halophilus]|jgi:uncharacterized protein